MPDVCTTSAVTLRQPGVTVEEEAASMAFTLYSLLQTAILCTNAIAVLHEERFLSKSEFWGVLYVLNVAEMKFRS